jgi:hypothetical protein
MRSYTASVLTGGGFDDDVNGVAAPCLVGRLKWTEACIAFPSKKDFTGERLRQPV